MPQDLVEIQVEQPQKEDNYQEYTELENLDGFRFEADIYDMHSVTLKVRDIQVWYLWLGKIHPSYNDKL